MKGMFEVIKNAFHIPELRKKILITVALIIVFRLGCFIAVSYTHLGRAQSGGAGVESAAV